jgi:hypothetical protein
MHRPRTRIGVVTAATVALLGCTATATATPATSAAQTPVAPVSVPVAAEPGAAEPGAAEPGGGTEPTDPTEPGTTAEPSQLPPYEVWQADVAKEMNAAKDFIKSKQVEPGTKPAIILDIDNTAKEVTYKKLQLPHPANKPVLEVAQLAKQKGMAVIFVSSRSELLRPTTQQSLEAVGYPVDELHLRNLTDFRPTVELKTEFRKEAEEDDGYTIVANIGNNQKDLDGGHAERTFKLPDYNGQLI